MGKLKLWAAAVSAVAVIGFSGSDMATGCDNYFGSTCGATYLVTDDEVSSANGQFNPGGTPIYYAGLITFSVAGFGDINVICDDYTDDIYTGHHNYVYQVENADNYLGGGPNGLSTTVIHEIAGLAFYALGNAGNGANAATAQMAIWSLMYGGSYNGQNFNVTGVATLISQASYYYSLMVAQGWSYFELVSVVGNCKPAEDMVYTDTPGCQNQGQIGLWNPDNPPIVLPEPGSIGLMGLGLLVLGGLQLRRRTRKADLA